MTRTLLTEGNVFSTLLKFSLPFLIANILQALYGAADLFMVGQFSHSADVCAVAIGGQIMQTITGLIIGLTTGGTVLIGQSFGARKKQSVLNSIKTITILFLFLSVIMTAAMLIFLERVISVMQVPHEALIPTRQYLFICCWGIVFIVGYNVISGILRGLGDSRTPLLFITAACAVNVGADLILVGVLKMGAMGAAAATVAAQAASLLFAVFYLFRKGYFRKYRSGNPIFRMSALRNVLSTGLPIALQEGLVNISFLIITAIINDMGLIASAAVGVAEKLIVFSMLPTTAFASAVAAMTAQNRGAGLMLRARGVLRAGIAMSLVFGIGCFLLAQFYGPSLVRLFSTDPLVIQSGTWYLCSYSVDCILVCFVFCLNAYFSSSGHPVFPLIHSLLAAFLIRIPFSYLLTHMEMPSLFVIGFAAPAASFLSLILCKGYLKYLTFKEW